MQARRYYIDSRDRLPVAGSTDSNFSIQLQIPQAEQYTHVSVTGVTIPKSYYNCPAGQNTFVLQEGVQQVTVSLPVGSYSLTSFQTVLAATLNAISPNGWVYASSSPNTRTSASTGKITYTVTGSGGSQPSFIFTNFVFELFGFSANSTNTFVANSLTSTNVVKFTLEDSLYIHSNICENEQDNILQTIYSGGTTDFGSVRYECKDYHLNAKTFTGQSSNIFYFILTDEADSPINLNGLNMIIELMIFRESGADLAEKNIPLGKTERDKLLNNNFSLYPNLPLRV